MRKIIIPLLVIAMSMLMSCQNNGKEENVEAEEFSLQAEDVERTTRSLKEYYNGAEADRIDRGVKQAAALWQGGDGTADDFFDFCMQNFVADSAKRVVAFNKIQRNLEILFGYGNTMTIKLLEPLHLDGGEVDFIDEVMGAYSSTAHISEDLFANKVAFYTILNFPSYSLKEKKKLAKD